MLVIFAAAISPTNSASAIAKASSLSMQIDTDLLELDVFTSPVGEFDSTDDATILVHTDNYTGYTLNVVATGSNSLVSQNNNEIVSLPAASLVTEQDFSTNSNYNNKWGYKPSKRMVTSGGVDSFVSNTSYLQVPTSSGTLLDVTNAANSVDNSYTISFGVRVDSSQSTGVYEYTYVVQAVANSILYNVTYDDNTTGTVNSMPSPNPQVLEIDGGTPTAQSYGTLSSAVPTMADKSFGGWCDVVPTHNSVTDEDECSGNTYAARGQYPIDQTSSVNNITLYAIWKNDPFPMVWTQMGACEFHAATNGNITGTECQDYTSDKFIDTGVALYNTANYLKDYEVHFTIDRYVPSENNGLADQQQTFVSDKLSPDVTSSPYDGKGPGMVVRRSGDSIQIRSTSGHASSDSNNSAEIAVSSSTTTDISVYRIDGVIYASINHGALQKIQDITGFDQQFGLNTWFGAYPGDDCTGNTTNGVCTNAIRYIEATLSNMYIKLGDFGKTIHTITFNGNGGVPSTTTYSVIDGDSLGTLPTATRTNYVLMYWYTTSGGNSIATPETKPHGDATYYAFWLKEVSQATISNSSITLAPEGTETINVTNSAELEDYTFTSNDEAIATVNSATGLVTAVGTGTTTITMTGTHSGTTKTITVTVLDSLAQVTFDAGQGSSVNPIEVEHGGTISELPISIRSGYTLEGWYTGANGTGTKLTTSLQINNDMEFIANWIVTTNVCRLADPNALHSEKCLRSSSGCRTSNVYAYNEDITYGKTPDDLEDPTVLEPGLAYTCDINANNEYDEETERFYLLAADSNKATLVWYKNISDVSINYDAAYALLPDSSTWRNTNLISQANDKVTRYMKASEVTTACGGSTNGLRTKTCVYLMEKSNYANTNMIDGIWLEKVSNASNGGRRIHTTGLSLGNVNPNTGGSNNAPRPVIEIPLNMLEVWSASDYTITFNPHNGTVSWDETVSPGDTLGNAYPANDPTYTNHIFQGWYTADTGGTLVTSNTEPSGSTTYHAQWKGTVALATVANNSISLTTNDTATVTVTNAAELEGFSFSSSDTSVATIDASTGVITPVAAGTTNISITGATSNTTNQIVTVTVTQGVVQYIVYFNPHNGESNSSVTVNAGSTIGNNNIPADPVNSDSDMIFMGWYTAASGGTLVDGSTTPTANGETYHAQYEKIVCKIETSRDNLHVHGDNVKYGDIADDPTPAAGDAYNCDVDYDDTYSAVNERFYYVDQDANNNAVLVAWNSYYNDTWAAGTSNDTIFTYTDALAELPDNTSGAWDNPGLIEQETGKAARFTSRAEVASACNKTTSQMSTADSLVSCDYFMEHSSYDGGGRSALWLMKENTTQYRIHGGSGNRRISTSDTGSSMVRPTIVVPYKLIEKYSSASGSDTPVTFDVSNDATRGYQALSAQWAQSPVNLTTFNKDTTTINDSTWGDTSELSELQYWTAIRNNFVNNQCFIQTSTANNTNSDAVKPLSALSAWTSGSVDCSKPDVYDTEVGAALTVRLNDAQGTVVAYAKAESGVIHNMIPGQTYYWEKTSDSSVYGYVTAVSNGSSTGTRWVDTDVVRNARDLGGLPVTYTDSNNQTVTGTLAYGRIFRGEKLQNVSVSELTNLGITTEYNVGDEYSGDTHLSDYHLNNVIHYDFDYNSGDENNASSNYMKAWTAVTNIMTDIANTNTTKNVYIHCRIGADRTGTVAYLLEGLLGVPDEQRYEEYGLSNLAGLYDRTRYYKQKASNNANKFVYMMGYVLTNQDIYNWYMHNPNADATLIQNFRTAMTVTNGSQQQQSPAPAQQNNLSSTNLNSVQSLNTNSENESETETENENETENETSYSNSDSVDENIADGYSEPLGVRKDDTNNQDSSVTGVAIAVAVVAAAGAAAYVLEKDDKDEEKQ